MKTIVQNGYGSPDVLELKEIDKPAVEDNDVLVRVYATSIHAGDYFTMRGEPFAVRLAFGLSKPKGNYIPGYDVAGRVEAVGKGVTRLQPGDEVFGACSGGCAEYVCTAEDNLVLKPADVTFEQAAPIATSASAALHGLRDAGKVRSGQKVLINGASGGVGTFAVQIAKSYGAEVTGVCSTRNVDLVRSIGADHVIDYTQEDFTQGGPRYDLILDNVANHSLSDCRRALTPNGLLVPNSGHSGLSYVIKGYLSSVFVRQQGRPFLSTPNKKDLTVLKDLVEAGKVTPVIDRTYPLAQVAEAMAYVGEGHARGKVVIAVAGESGI
jgi:NADPH:quinone reductase-like Zn-dependent oxidoreductase